MTTIRDKQIMALTSLLSFNPTTTNSNSSGTSTPNNTTNNNNASSSLITPIPTWKVLVMDKVGQDIMATTFQVKDLRDLGVTLHM